MKITFDFAMTNDGKIGFFARGDVSAADAKKALEQLMAALGSDNITLTAVTPVEQHRDDPRIQAVHDLTHHKH